MFRNRIFFEDLHKTIAKGARTPFEEAQGLLAVEQARQLQRHNVLLLLFTIAITIATMASAYFQSPYLEHPMSDQKPQCRCIAPNILDPQTEGPSNADETTKAEPPPLNTTPSGETPNGDSYKPRDIAPPAAGASEPEN